MEVAIAVDSKAAWMVTLSSFFMQFLTIGYLKSSGILMKMFKEQFNCSATILMLMTCSTFSLIALLSPLYTKLATKILLRYIVIVISLLICGILVGLSFCFSLITWMIGMGLLLGILLSGTYGSVICKVVECFDNYRDLALGIGASGSSVGAMLVPQLFTYITSEYDVKGTVLLLGGYFLHYVIIGVGLPTKILPKENSEHIPKVRHNSVLKSDGLGLSMASLHPIKDPSVAVEKMTRSQTMLTMIFCIATIFANIGFTTQYIIFPSFVSESKISPRTTAILISCQGLADLVARLLTGWVSDRVSWRKSFIMIVGMSCLGVGCLFMTITVVIVETEAAQIAILAIYCIVSGAGAGIYIAIQCSVLNSFVGTSHFSSMFSVVLCCWGLCTVPAQILIGYITDLTLSFWWGEIVCGSCMLIACVIQMLELGVTRDNKFKTESEAKALLTIKEDSVTVTS